jgi:Tfp pilus assembly protein PilF
MGGLPVQARAHHYEALTLADQLGARYERARAHDGLAHTYLVTGELIQARQHWQQALSVYTSLGFPESENVLIRLEDLGEA